MVERIMIAARDEWLPTRSSLLSRLRHWDDRRSWQDFFDLYGRLIYDVAIKAGLNDSDAQEVVQETVISVARNMPGFKYDPAICSFKSWLMRITRSRLINQLKKRDRDQARRNRDVSEAQDTALWERIPDPAGSELERLWDAEWDKSLALAALDRVKRRVPARQYQIFDLHVLKEWTIREVTLALNVNAGQVYLAKHRLGRLLKQEIQHLQKDLV
jgi:RNA polymerase sigma factor (sigma-70 family)